MDESGLPVTEFAAHRRLTRRCLLQFGLGAIVGLAIATLVAVKMLLKPDDGGSGRAEILWLVISGVVVVAAAAVAACHYRTGMKRLAALSDPRLFEGLGELGMLCARTHVAALLNRTADADRRISDDLTMTGLLEDTSLNTHRALLFVRAEDTGEPPDLGEWRKHLGAWARRFVHPGFFGLGLCLIIRKSGQHATPEQIHDLVKWRSGDKPFFLWAVYICEDLRGAAVVFSDLYRSSRTAAVLEAVQEKLKADGYAVGMKGKSFLQGA